MCSKLTFVSVCDAFTFSITIQYDILQHDTSSARCERFYKSYVIDWSCFHVLF